MARSNKVYFLFCAVIYLNLLGHGYSISDIIVEFGGMKLNVERLEKEDLHKLAHICTTLK